MAKILLVEDNEMNYDMLSRRLRKKGYEVDIATDGEAGVEMAQKVKPDLILMDMDLPKIDGWEATRRIRAIPDVAAVRIIALTAHAMVSDREKCIEAGCNDFDTKPIDIERLAGKIAALLAKGTVS